MGVRVIVEDMAGLEYLYAVAHACLGLGQSTTRYNSSLLAAQHVLNASRSCFQDPVREKDCTREFEAVVIMEGIVIIEGNHFW